MNAPLPDATLDLRREVCPMTYVRAKLKLESMAPGAVLAVFVSSDEAAHGVPQSAREDGYEILSLEPQADHSYRLLLRNSNQRRT